MLLKSIKTKALVIFLSLCVSNGYPLTEKAARNWALALGFASGAPVGAGLGTLAKYSKWPFNNEQYPSVAAWAVGIGSSCGWGLFSSYFLYQLLYQYTPKPTLEHAQTTIEKTSKDSAFAQDFIKLSQCDLLKQLSKTFGQDANMENILDQFKNFISNLDKDAARLDAIKNDLENEQELIQSYEKVTNQMNTLKSYLSVRFALITTAIAATDNLLRREFRDYQEFGKNKVPAIHEVESRLKKLEAYLNTAQQSLDYLVETRNANAELKLSFYSLDELNNTTKLLKNVATLRVAQVNVFLLEQSFESNLILSRYFVNEREILDYLYVRNADSNTNWPLINAKQGLNTELEQCHKLYYSVSQISDSFNQNQMEYKRQVATILNKLQKFTNIIETNLTLIVQSREYVNQVRLYEEHREKKRQRKLEQERIERQQALERQRLAEENKRQREQLEQNRKLLEQGRRLEEERQRQENKLAEERKKHAAANPFANASAPSYEAVNNNTPPPSYEELFPTPSAPSYEAVYSAPPTYTPHADTNSQEKYEQLPPPPPYESLYSAK